MNQQIKLTNTLKASGTSVINSPLFPISLMINTGTQSFIQRYTDRHLPCYFYIKETLRRSLSISQYACTYRQTVIFLYIDTQTDRHLPCYFYLKETLMRSERLRKGSLTHNNSVSYSISQYACTYRQTVISLYIDTQTDRHLPCYFYTKETLMRSYSISQYACTYRQTVIFLYIDTQTDRHHVTFK